MPRPCSVCQHPERPEIDRALVGGEPYRRIAPRYGVSDRALRRHAAEHVPTTLARAAQAGEVARADDLLSQVQSLQGRTLSILEAAEQTGNLRTALAAIRESRGNLELLGKLAGELNDSPTVNVLISAEWVELRAVIIGALQNHPEARESVLKALEGGSYGSP